VGFSPTKKTPKHCVLLMVIINRKFRFIKKICLLLRFGFITSGPQRIAKENLSTRVGGTVQAVWF
jgi:hypothetical protein